MKIRDLLNPWGRARRDESALLEMTIRLGESEIRNRDLREARLELLYRNTRVLTRLVRLQRLARALLDASSSPNVQFIATREHADQLHAAMDALLAELPTPVRLSDIPKEKP